MNTHTQNPSGAGSTDSPPSSEEPKLYLEYLTHRLAEHWLVYDSSWEDIAPHYASNVRMDIDGVVFANSRDEFRDAFLNRDQRQGHVTNVNVVMKEGNKRADIWIQSDAHTSDVNARRQVSMLVKWVKIAGIWKIHKITGFHGLDAAIPIG